MHQTGMDSTDHRLADQYESFPYPQRDPRDEARRLVIGSPSHLREIDHWVFGGARSKALELRCLVAGGGTGDGTIMLATQLARAARPGTVTWLDRSQAALRIARARADQRKLENIRWERRSLLDLPGSGLGPFDYIDCCGVLHHLPDPAEGLAALLSVLAPGGGLGLMLYAPHGRTGVYMLQDALARLAPPDEPPAARLDVARRVMRHLPGTAWLRRNGYFADHLSGGDAGLYDLLLNPRDRAFDVPALYRLIDSAGLRISALIEPLRYDPATWLPDPRLRALAGVLDPVSRAALAEALTGNMSTHVFYAVRADDKRAAVDPLSSAAVPTTREIPGEDIVRLIRPDGTLGMVFDGLSVPVAMPRLAAPILRLVDGQRSVGDITASLVEKRLTDVAGAKRAWRSTWEALNAVNWLLLAAPA